MAVEHFMTRRVRARLWSLAVVAGIAFGPGVARTLADSTGNDEVDSAKSEFSQLWNVDQLMDRAANNIAMRYNLNTTQREQTREMLRTEVTKFLNDHPDIWPLVRDLARLQQAGEKPQGKIAERLGQKAIPLMQDIENSILEANQRWRSILTDDQKRMHDYDLQDMAKTFAQMDDHFREMADGKPVEPRIFPQPNRDAPQPPRPKTPPPNYKPDPPSPVQGELPTEHMWDQYVHKFIRDYKLNDAQSEAALSVLKECKERAEDYRKSKRAEFDQVETRLREAQKGDQSPEVHTAKLRVWKQIQVSLNKPIVDLFQELQDRLDALPTEQQRAYARSLGVEVRRVPRKPRGAAADAPPKPDAAADGEQAAPTGEGNPQPAADQPTAGGPAEEAKSPDEPATAEPKAEAEPTGEAAPPE